MQEPDIRKAPTAPLPVSISMTSPEIRYIGRFDWRDKAGPRCAWSASALQFRFQGSALQIALREFGANEYQVVIDDVPTTILKPKLFSSLNPAWACIPWQPTCRVERTRLYWSSAPKPQ